MRLRIASLFVKEVTAIFNAANARIARAEEAQASIGPSPVNGQSPISDSPSDMPEPADLNRVNSLLRNED